MNYWLIFGGLIITHIELTYNVEYRGGGSKHIVYKWPFIIIGLGVMLKGLQLI